MRLDVGYTSRPCAGERVSGDAVVVREAAGRTLVGVIDALGHGPSAHDVAAQATRFLATAELAALPDLFARLDGALVGSRGIAATLCLFDGARLSYGGVGNVELRVPPDSASLPMVLTPGILGRLRRPVRTFDAPLQPGRRFVLLSDGISSRVSLSDTRALPPERASRDIVAAAGRAHDDATALVADVIA